MVTGTRQPTGPYPGSAPAPAPAAQSSAERTVTTACATAYTWFDNTPAGSATISHPVLHKSAGGAGTFEDPITIAVGHSLASGRDVLDFPAGTRLYLPDVRRYFIVEDTCGDGNDPRTGHATRAPTPTEPTPLSGSIPATSAGPRFPLNRDKRRDPQ
ncbi:MAG: hypothetical protein HOQ04_11190 [Pseudarthrobacter sp.]|nr:hypothetical protein [Pseudarthrobacter sp.]